MRFFRWVPLWLAGIALAVIGATFPLWRNVLRISSSDRPPVAPVSMAQCRDCHFQITRDYMAAAHWNTLFRGNAPKVLARFADQKTRIDPPGQEFAFHVHEGNLWIKTDAYPAPLPVDWVFGSGHHGQTSVSVSPPSAGPTVVLEHHVTLFADRAGLGLTLGHIGKIGEGMAAVGNELPPDPAFNCFKCHTTSVSRESGQIDFTRIQPGIDCARCHAQAAKHAAAAERGEFDTEHWSKLTPRASVHRCGECHRREENFSTRDLRPENLELVRFASVSLIQTACFIGQERLKAIPGANSRLDCMTCHDPHRQSETDPAFYNRKCLECHAPEQPGLHPCRKEAPTSNCIACHLPKVEVEPGIRFSDHWIRVHPATVP